MTELGEVSFLPTLYFHTGGGKHILNWVTVTSKPIPFTPASHLLASHSQRRVSKNGIGTRKYSVPHTLVTPLIEDSWYKGRTAGGGGHTRFAFCTGVSGRHHLLRLPSTSDVVRRTLRAKGSYCRDAANLAGGKTKRERGGQPCRGNLAGELLSLFSPLQALPWSLQLPAKVPSLLPL